MFQGKWENLLDRIERMFGFIEHSTREYSEQRKTVETAVFEGATGRIKLERTVKPVVLDTRRIYSKQAGGEVTEQYVLSDDEFVDTLRVYRWDELAREWTEIDLEDLDR